VFNLSQFNLPISDRAITDARSTFDTDTRIAKYADFQNIFSNELPALILDQNVFVYEMRQRVQGITIQALANPEDRFLDITHWYLSTTRALK